MSELMGRKKDVVFGKEKGAEKRKEGIIWVCNNIQAHNPPLKVSQTKLGFCPQCGKELVEQDVVISF